MKQIATIALSTGHSKRIGRSMRGRFRKRMWAPALFLALTSVGAHAADVVVTNAAGSGAGTLRQAIVDVSAGGTITFDPTLAGQTISLSSELILSKNLTIDASALANGITVDGGGTVRLFRVDTAGNVTLRGLTLTAGKGTGVADGFGGALHNLGTSVVDRCTFKGNSATQSGGGIFNGQNATMTVQSCTFTVDGGSTGNSAGLYGGAIFNSSVMTVNGCTFDRNTTAFEGGALYTDFSSTLMLTNSTFVGNTANFYGGAIFNGSPRLEMKNLTIVGNNAVRIGGGIYSDFFGSPSVSITNTILTENTAPQGPNTFGPWTGTNNITSGDPKLSPLGNYGGATKTMPPLPDSPAIDGGGSTSLLTDQRGQPRVLRDAPDIGAYEIPTSEYNRTGVTIHARVSAPDQEGVFEISTDPNFLPVVSTYAGTGTSGASTGARLSAQLGFPSGVAQDSLGNTFFADTANHRICMVGSDGLVVSIAGTGGFGRADGPGPTAAFAFPSALAVGPDDNVYVSDTFNHRIAKVTRPAVPGGVWTVTNLAGTGEAGFNEGAGSVARFRFPYGLTLDAAGNVYVADSDNHRIRKVTALGAVSTYAGSGSQGLQNSVTPSLAKFDTPHGVVISGGNLYIADSRNHLIRKVVPNGANAGEVSTFAGSSEGFMDATGTSARFDTPSAITTDGAGSLYIADEQNHRIRKIDALGGVTTVAGTGDDGLVNGKSDIAEFHAPTGVSMTLDGNLLVADAENHVIRRVAIKPLTVPATPFNDSYGVQVKYELDVLPLGLDPGVTYYFRWKSTSTGITQVLGQSFYLYDFPSVETVPATSLTPDAAVLNTTVDPKYGRTIVSFEYSTDPDLKNPYEVTTVAALSNASGVVTNAAGDAFVADRLGNKILKITPAGVVSTFAGSGVPGFHDGLGTAAKFEKPAALAIDGAGNLYVADEASHRIRIITPAGDVSTFAGSGVAGFAEGTAGEAEFLYPTGVAVDDNGVVYVADSGNHRIRRISAGTVTTLAGNGIPGSANGVVGSAQFSNPQSVAVDSSGGVLVADTGNHSIRVISAGNVTTLAGDGNEGFQDGPGGAAKFSSPRGVVEGAGGVVYVTDTGNHRIREISPDAEVSTLAGSGIAGQVDTPTVALFPATASRFNLPVGIAINPDGALLVTQEGSLRKIERSAALPTITLTPDADGNGERDLLSAVNRPLLYGTTYYFRARGTSYRDSITGEILSFVTRRGEISVFANTSQLSHLQSDVVDFSNTPTGQPFTRQFTISNPGTWPLTISSVALPGGFQQTGGVVVIPPLGTADFQITVTAAVAGNYSGNVVITNDAPEKTVFSFPVAGVVLDPPVLTTLDATLPGAGTATFNATVNPRDSATDVWFEWSQDPDFDGVNVSTLAGEFNQPSGIVADAAGNIFIADRQDHRIRKIAADGTVSIFAGSGAPGYANGAGEGAQFDQPVGLAINAAGTLFVADSNNHRIRAIDPAGVVSTYSGLGTIGFTDGIATAARFTHPAGLAIDNLGRLYVADSGNNRIRVVATDGSVSTLSGTGEPGSGNGAGNVAEFDGPVGIARDASGFVYVTESAGHAVRKIAPDGFTSVFAGNVATADFADASGTTARFSSPVGLSVGIGGVVYVADKGNNRIRRISPDGSVVTIAGTGTPVVLDGFGDVAGFFNPISLVATANGGVIVGEAGTSAVRKITSLQVLLPASTGLVGTTTLPVVLAVNGLPTSGPYYFRSIATNGGGTTIGATLGVNQAISTYDAWKFAKFGSDAGNPLISGMSANPSGDGISNLLKYAFGLDPLSPAPGSIPVMGLSGGALTLTYTKVLAATDLVYTVEWSEDLATWSSAGVIEQTVGGDSETSQIRATAPVVPASAKFLRVHVTLQ
ncbi:choice-of-anchor D domain-containing protein [Luteolibacter yonseiensis]|uniref:Choice-of-anchor D domain-containing protein n=1 Tax=Luteolibacter yonseiensis TaxID=1144680 RepID=A0A934R054_9BACT|nr:choice-of-anchor Q domain-containing protein [Luteolibacter yonseiensis]MBK1814272.1 choice-of-anchor D domain-containing protein [Luteolibacter yonseiensis]